MEILLTLFCFIVSIVFSHKKMKILSYFQVVLSFIVFLLVSTLFIDESIFRENSGIRLYVEAIKDVMLNYRGVNGCEVSIASIIVFAMVFLTVLSIFSILEYVKSKKLKEESETKVPLQIKKSSNFFYVRNEKKKYLKLCRLLN